MLPDKNACELGPGRSHNLHWWCLEGVDEESQKEVTPCHWFEQLLLSLAVSTVSQGSVGLSGASKRIAVTFSSWKYLGVVFVVGFWGLLKIPSWQNVLASFQQALQTSSMELSICPIQWSERSAQGLNIWLELGGLLHIIEQWSKLLTLSEPQLSLLKNRYNITCLSGMLGVLNKTIHVKALNTVRFGKSLWKQGSFSFPMRRSTKPRSWKPMPSSWFSEFVFRSRNTVHVKMSVTWCYQETAHPF